MRINKKNLEKNKSLSFLLIFYDKENVFFLLYGTEGVLNNLVFTHFTWTCRFRPFLEAHVVNY